MNNLYNFCDINQESQPNAVSSDAVFLVDKKQTLDEYMQNFVTLNVEGRGQSELDISTADTSGDGSVFLNSKYKQRKLTLQGFLDCFNSTDLNQSLDRLNKLFSNGLIQFSFNDEQNYRYTGLFSVKKVEKGTITPIVDIEINLFDPFKYSNDIYTLNAGTSFNITSNIGICDTNGGYRPTRLSFTADMTNNVTFTVKSTDKRRNGKRIKLTPYAGTHSGYIDFDKGGQLFIGGALSNTYLDISSDLFSFVLNNGDTIETNATTCSAEFKMKGV